MNAIFVDTGVWVAHFNARDRLHTRAADILSTATVRLVTSWPVVWETVTLLCRQGGATVAADVGLQFLGGRLAHILELTTTDHVLAWDILRRYADRRLSAADVTTGAIVRRINIPTVASFDVDMQLILPDRTILGLT